MRRQLLSFLFEAISLSHNVFVAYSEYRYADLLTKHGELDPLASVTLQPADTVAMTVICDDKEALFDIPTKQTIG